MHLESLTHFTLRPRHFPSALLLNWMSNSNRSQPNPSLHPSRYQSNSSRQFQLNGSSTSPPLSPHHRQAMSYTNLNPTSCQPVILNSKSRHPIQRCSTRSHRFRLTPLNPPIVIFISLVFFPIFLSLKYSLYSYNDTSSF